jgi:curved DNA-binding protein CbpA
MKTLYDLIGARRDDDAESLKKAYRNAVKANHPDYHADDPEAVRRFMQITAAYDILRDTEQRVAYDRTLESCREPPNATLRHTDPPRRRFFVSNMSVRTAIALMLSGAFLLFAGVAGVSIDDVIGRRAPQANATAAVQPAALQLPITVTGPSVATSTAQERSASGETRDRTASIETQNMTPSEETKDRPASQETAQARRAIYVAEHDVNTDLINRPSAPKKHNGDPSSESYGPRLAKRDLGSDLRTDVRTRGPAFAETLPPANKPAPKVGTVIEYDRQLPTVACQRRKVTATDKNGSIILRCGDKIAYAADGNSKKNVSKSGDTPNPDPKPDSFSLGPLCLSVNSKACPIGGDEQRR